MFVTKERFEWWQAAHERSYTELKQKYWDLLNKHYRLLEHLGLNERDIPPHTILEKKGGPEQP